MNLLRREHTHKPVRWCATVPDSFKLAHVRLLLKRPGLEPEDLEELPTCVEPVMFVEAY